MSHILDLAIRSVVISIPRVTNAVADRNVSFEDPIVRNDDGCDDDEEDEEDVAIDPSSRPVVVVFCDSSSDWVVDIVGCGGDGDVAAAAAASSSVSVSAPPVVVAFVSFDDDAICLMLLLFVVSDGGEIVGAGDVAVDLFLNSIASVASGIAVAVSFIIDGEDDLLLPPPPSLVMVVVFAVGSVVVVAVDLFLNPIASVASGITVAVSKIKIPKNRTTNAKIFHVNEEEELTLDFIL